jgi:hypothetical protein
MNIFVIFNIYNKNIKYVRILKKLKKNIVKLTCNYGNNKPPPNKQIRQIHQFPHFS